MTMVISSLDREYVGVIIGTSEDPTTDVVRMAFIADGGKPEPSDWKDAAWDPTPVPSLAVGQYRARCLVAGEDAENQAAAVVLEIGSYGVWTKVTDNPEVPVKLAGTLKVK